MNAEENDEIHARELAKRLRNIPRPLCPQFRECDVERLYPVQGYCALAQSPAWFMVPSIEEFREYCTTSRFAQCCWFSGGRETGGSVEGRREGPPIRVDTWHPPEVLQPTLGDTI